MTAMAIRHWLHTITVMQSKIGGRRCAQPFITEAENSGYHTSWGTSNAESVAQVNRCPQQAWESTRHPNGRFIKNNYSTLDALASFYNDKGGFKHSQSDTTASNGLATEQAYYALAWYED